MSAKQEAPGVDRRRHGPSVADERERTPVERRPQRAPTVEAAFLDLQRSAGNRSVAALLGGAVVQRKPAPGSTNDGGILKLGSGAEIPIQSATWAMNIAVATDRVGAGQAPTIHPAGISASELKLTRRPDKKSKQAADLFGMEFETGTIRLDRPSRDGAIPATNLDLGEVSVISYASREGDEPTETLSLGVGWLKIKGLGKDEAAAPRTKGAQRPTQWELRVNEGGADAWPAIPLIAVEYSTKETAGEIGEIGEMSMRTHKMRREGPYRAKVRMGAGPGLTQLARLPSAGQQVELAFAIGGDVRLQLSQAIVEKISSSDEGPDVVDVDFVAELARFRAPSGGKTGGQAGASTR